MNDKRRVVLGMIIALLLGIVLGACGGEGPESLYDTAQFEEKQTNFEHARQLYNQIIENYPDSEFAQKAQGRLERLEKTAIP
ncbi:MAG: hypothetical protein IH977_10500 [Nitrospinae bacterium]|nr:hypothetical protein [Nitrospinota bacterium]